MGKAPAAFLAVTIALTGAACTPSPTSTPTGTAAVSAPTARTSPPARASAPTAQSTKAAASPSELPPYKRYLFTRTGERWHWTDLDGPGPGCDGRTEALDYWATGEHYSRKCHIDHARQVFDFYTGATYTDVDTSTLEGDHVIALAVAWQWGAWEWDRERRTRFANYRPNVVMTTPAINGCTRTTGKCDHPPSEWVPANRARACAWATLVGQVVRAWRLHPDRDSRASLRHTVATAC